MFEAPNPAKKSLEKRSVETVLHTLNVDEAVEEKVNV